MEVVFESTTTTGVGVPQSFTLKDPTKYTKAEKELVCLDTSLQLIIVKATLNDMSHQFMDFQNARQMWETVELLMGGTEEMKENRLDIPTSLYKAFIHFPEKS